MLKKTSKHLLKSGTMLVLALAVLPGCEFGSSKKSSTSSSKSSSDMGTVLCKVDGKSVINEAEFNKNIEQMMQANPYFKGAGAQGLPAAVKRKFFDELVKQELIIANATKNNIESDADFKKSLEEMEKLIRRSLIVQSFEKKLYDNISIDDSDIKKHFEENKERFVKSPGGVLVGAVRFDTDKDADAFKSQAADSKVFSDFEKHAKTHSSQFRNFGRVNNSPRGYQFESVPAAIKDAALDAKSLPLLTKVKSGKDVWVIHASDKRDSEFFDLAEIKPQIIGMLKNNKFREKLDATIADLRKEHSVDTNEDFFKEEKKESHEATGAGDHAGHDHGNVAVGA